MKAYVIDGPGRGGVRTVPDPSPAHGEVLVRITRAGVCGTDRELFAGTLRPVSGRVPVTYPRIPGHEWTGVVEQVGGGVDAARVGQRVVGDTFVGCGSCRACAAGRTPICADRAEIGVRGRDGALAELLCVPAANAIRIPDELDDTSAALVEPLSNVVRAFRELPASATHILVRGAGALGLLAARLAITTGHRVDLVDPDSRAARTAERLGIDVEPRPRAEAQYDGVMDLAPADAMVDALAAVSDGGTIVITGFPSSDATIPARTVVERDLKIVGTLGAPAQIGDAIRAAGIAEVAVIASAPSGLDAVGSYLSGAPAPDGSVKLHIDPRLPTAPEPESRW